MGGRTDERLNRLEGPRFRAIFSPFCAVADVAEWLRDPTTLPIGSGVSPSGRQIFVKRHARPRWKAARDQIGRRPSPSRRALEIGIVLAEAEVDAVRPLASIESRSGRETFTVLEHIDGPDLGRFLEASLPPLGPEMKSALKRCVWTAVARLVARLHAAGVRQRDLKAPNILLCDGLEPREEIQAPCRERPVLVDLEGMQLLGAPPSRRVRVRDLARLVTSLRVRDLSEAGVSSTDIDELVGLYLVACRPVFGKNEDPDRWVKSTRRWAEKKEEQNRRRGRPLR